MRRSLARFQALDREFAAIVMQHPIHRIRSFDIVAPYTLRIRFGDATVQTIDFNPILAGELYGPLRDPSLLNQVRVDPEVHTLIWPNGADFDPATLTTGLPTLKPGSPKPESGG
jgi:hypothetical protein